MTLLFTSQLCPISYCLLNIYRFVYSYYYLQNNNHQSQLQKGDWESPNSHYSYRGLHKGEGKRSRCRSLTLWTVLISYIVGNTTSDCFRFRRQWIARTALTPPSTVTVMSRGRVVWSSTLSKMHAWGGRESCFHHDYHYLFGCDFGKYTNNWLLQYYLHTYSICILNYERCGPPPATWVWQFFEFKLITLFVANPQIRTV